MKDLTLFQRLTRKDIINELLCPSTHSNRWNNTLHRRRPLAKVRAPAARINSIGLIIRHRPVIITLADEKFSFQFIKKLCFAESPEYETLRRCRELKTDGGNNGSQESLGTTTGTAGRPPLPQRCSSLERPVVPPPGKTKSEKVNKKNSLVLQQQTDNQQPASSILPDFHQAAPDMSTCNSFVCPSRAHFYSVVDPSSSAGDPHIIISVSFSLSFASGGCPTFCFVLYFLRFFVRHFSF